MPTRNLGIISEQEKKNIGAVTPANSMVLSSFTLLGRHAFQFIYVFNYTMLPQIFLVESLSRSKKHNRRKFSAASRGGGSSTNICLATKGKGASVSLSRHQRTGAFFFAFSATKPRDEHLKKARRQKSSNPLAKKKQNVSFWHSNEFSDSLEVVVIPL